MKNWMPLVVLLVVTGCEQALEPERQDSATSEAASNVYVASPGPQACSKMAPTFFVDPTSYGNPIDPTLDSEWQAAAGAGFHELDLDGYSDRAIVSGLSAGSIAVDVGLGGIRGEAPAALIFQGGYPSGGGVYGTVYGGALINLYDGWGNDFAHGQVRFDFSEPVFGFGAWVFDDAGRTSQSFRLTATFTDGTASTSQVLESGNGDVHYVEGFLGVTSAFGVTAVALEVLDEFGRAVVFETDHIQVSPLTCTGAEQLGALSNQIMAMLSDGTIDDGNANALLATLDNALKSLEMDKPNAVNLLQAFVNKVEGFVNGSILSESEAAPLVAAAQVMITQLT